MQLVEIIANIKCYMLYRPERQLLGDRELDR